MYVWCLGYINENGHLNMSRIEKYLDSLAEVSFLMKYIVCLIFHSLMLNIFLTCWLMKDGLQVKKGKMLRKYTMMMITLCLMVYVVLMIKLQSQKN